MAPASSRAGLAAKLVKVERKHKTVTVYNFEVEDFHTYFVGQKSGGLWVHNACKAKWAEQVYEGLHGGQKDLLKELSDKAKAIPGIRQNDTFKVRVFSRAEFDATVGLDERAFTMR